MATYEDALAALDRNEKVEVWEQGRSVTADGAPGDPHWAAAWGESTPTAIDPGKPSGHAPGLSEERAKHLVTRGATRRLPPSEGVAE